MNKIVPDYVRIRTYIIGLIAASRGEGMQRLPTERELCKTFNTSRTTLRKALKQLEDEGYLIRKPHFGTYINSEYRSMVDFHTLNHKVVGIVLGNGELTFLPAYMMRVLSHLLEHLAKADCCGRILNINGCPEKEFDFLLNNHQFDAFVFIEPPQALMSYASMIRKQDIPLVVSRVHDIPEADYCVFYDSFKCARIVTEYLLDAGHHDILFLENADMDSPVNELRKAGAQAAFSKRGVIWNEKLWHCSMPVNVTEKIDNICKYGYNFSAVSTAESFYNIISSKLADRPEIPIVRTLPNPEEDSDVFQIIIPSGDVGEALGKLVRKVVHAPFGTVPRKHIEVDFQLKYPLGK